MGWAKDTVGWGQDLFRNRNKGMPRMENPPPMPKQFDESGEVTPEQISKLRMKPIQLTAEYSFKAYQTPELLRQISRLNDTIRKRDFSSNKAVFKLLGALHDRADERDAFRELLESAKGVIIELREGDTWQPLLDKIEKALKGNDAKD